VLFSNLAAGLGHPCYVEKTQGGYRDWRGKERNQGEVKDG